VECKTKVIPVIIGVKFCFFALKNVINTAVEHRLKSVKQSSDWVTARMTEECGFEFRLAKLLLSSPEHPDHPWTYPSSYLLRREALSRTVKWVGSENYHLSPSRCRG
jgi:hypothetical protein